MADKSFFFYDLETSGRSPRDQVIMQFAGQRTDMDLKPIGEPVNFLIKPADDVLPEPEAILITGITPQKASEEGIAESEAAVKILDECFTPGTTIVGYNSARFDNPFIQFLMWRNFRDPYAWGYADGRSTWDVIDLMRMARALRPDGLVWPETDGVPSTRLEELAKANGVTHESAHDALSDVVATIELTRMVKGAQPKLFNHLLKIRSKRVALEQLQSFDGGVFVHSSGQLDVDHMQTSVFALLGLQTGHGATELAWDLRFDPGDFASVKPDEVVELLFTRRDELEAQGRQRLGVKGIRANKCPAIAPLGVVDDAAWSRIGLTLSQIEKHRANLSKIDHLRPALVEVFDSTRPAPRPAKPAKKSDKRADKPAPRRSLEITLPDLAEGQLYEGFVPNADRTKLQYFVELKSDEQVKHQADFTDKRLIEMLPRYLMRNFSDQVEPATREAWEAYRAQVLSQKNLESYAKHLQYVAETNPEADEFLLQELALWVESIMPDLDSESVD